MHFNIQGGLTQKINMLNVFLENSNVYIVCLNEHWLDATNIKILNSIPNYTLASYYSRLHGIHGGTCILLRSNLTYIERVDINSHFQDAIFEGCAIEIPSLNIIVVSIYRTPDKANFNAFLTKLEALYIVISKEYKNKKICISGDFNVDLMKKCRWPLGQNLFLNLNRQYGFFETFNDPTRITSKTKTCIDNILVNKKFVQQKTLNLELGLSDHRALFVEVDDRISKGNNSIKKRVFSSEGIDQFNASLRNEDWNFDKNLPVQVNFDNFFNRFKLIFETHFPLKPCNEKRLSDSNLGRKKWVTLEIVNLSKRNRELHTLAKQSDNLVFKQYCKDFKKRFKSICNKAKKKANCKFIEQAENKSKAAWKIVNKELGLKVKTNNEFPNILCGDKLIEEGKSIANVFNERFANVSIDKEIVPKLSEAIKFTRNFTDNEAGVPPFSFKLVNSKKVMDVIGSLKNKRSSGWDEIPIFLLKQVASLISEPLCKLINQSLVSGIVPYQLKYAEIKPLHKKGSKSNVDDYRPVSLLTSFSKVFEKIVGDQIIFFFEVNNLLVKEQYGFRKNKCTGFAIADFIRCVLEGLDGSQSTAGVFCDLSKAFDCVQHDILLEKLRLYGFSHSALSWIKSYLSGRFQRTMVEKNSQKFKSHWIEVFCGVPQGSILGPLLFLIYINDLPQNLSFNTFLYADDASAILKANSINDLQHKIQSSLIDLQNWFKANGLKLNSSKTQIINFKTARYQEQSDLQIAFNNNFLSVVQTTKFLGLELDDKLNWKNYINILTKKLNSSCFQMHILRNILDKTSKLIVYHALFASIMQYGVELWGSSSYMRDIFKIQKKYLRIMTGAKPRTSCKGIFKELNVLTLPSLYILKSVNFVKSNFDILLTDQHFHNYNTRNKSDFQYPIHRLTSLEKSPHYIGKKLYNKLPSRIKNVVNNNRFKNEVKSLLLDKVYYSVNDFLDDILT
jgi:hypothetical protein